MPGRDSLAWACQYPLVLKLWGFTLLCVRLTVIKWRQVRLGTSYRRCRREQQKMPEKHSCKNYYFFSCWRLKIKGVMAFKLFPLFTRDKTSRNGSKLQPKSLREECCDWKSSRALKWVVWGSAIKPLLMEILKTKLKASARKGSGVPDSTLDTHLLSAVHVVEYIFMNKV